jgi:trehalose-6-phosphate synthase
MRVNPHKTKGIKERLERALEQQKYKIKKRKENSSEKNSGRTE